MAKQTSKNTVKKKKVKFTLEAPNAKNVSLMGDFNQWNEKAHPMKCTNNGVWEKAAMIPPGKYEYKFLVDDKWEMDPNNREICQNRFGTKNNILFVK